MAGSYTHYLTELPTYPDSDAMVNSKGIVVSETMPIRSPYRFDKEGFYKDSEVQSTTCQDHLESIQTASQWKSLYLQDLANKKEDATILEGTNKTDTKADTVFNGSTSDTGEDINSSISAPSHSSKICTNPYINTKTNSIICTFLEESASSNTLTERLLKSASSGKDNPLMVKDKGNNGSAIKAADKKGSNAGVAVNSKVSSIIKD
jgi:hypothetical protein